MYASLSSSELLATLLFLCSMPPKGKNTNYQERVAKRRRLADDSVPGTSGLQSRQQNTLASSGDPRGPSGLGHLTPELVATVTAAVSQALQAALPTSQVPQTPASHIQFVPDPVEPLRKDPPPATNDASNDSLPGASEAHTVQDTVTTVIDKVIGPQDKPEGQSKNTFLSEAIPLSNRVPEKVKKQIWSNEFVDFALLLHSNVINTVEERYTLKVETTKGGQPSVVLAPNTKKQAITNIDQWMSAFQTYVAIYAERIPGDTPALMKYGSVVRELALSGGNWRFYDENFRMLRQSQGATWDKIHSELWLRAQSFRARQTNPQKKVKPEGPYIPHGYCWKFHRGNFCRGCSFKHQCFQCGQSHPVTKCPKQQPTTSNDKKVNVNSNRSTPNTSPS